MTDIIEVIELAEPELEEPSAVLPADAIPGTRQGQWTYADYLKIPDEGKRYEIIEGVLYLMPSPNEAHQFIAGVIYYYLMTHIYFAGLGKVYIAPFDVDLSIGNMVQPDVIVVLNANRAVITKANITGSPDLVVEVSSPSTSSYDQKTKRAVYAKAGIKEYWIVRPSRKMVELLSLQDNQYISKGKFKGQALLPSDIVPNFPVQVSQFF